MPDIATPAELILARAAASRAGDFGFIYDSYLDDSNFRRQFPTRQEYLDFAREMLRDQVQLHECRILRERRAGDAAEVLFYQRLEVAGASSEMLEHAFLKRTPHGWRFDCSERLERAALSRALELIDWDDFARAPDKVIF